MYRKSTEVRRKAAIHKLLDNGHRYGVLLGETVIFSCRYDYEAFRKWPRKRVVALSTLI